MIHLTCGWEGEIKEMYDPNSKFPNCAFCPKCGENASWMDEDWSDYFYYTKEEKIIKDSYGNTWREFDE